MRRSEKTVADYEFPGRYALDEPRFTGGHERASNSSPQEADK